MKLYRIGCVAVGLLLVAAACGSSDDVQETQPDRAPDLSLIKGAIGEWELIPASSPEDLIQQRDPKVIIVGAVETIEQGRIIYQTDDPDPTTVAPSHQLVMQVRVSDTLRMGNSGEIRDGRVYVELAQGPVGPDGITPAYPLEEWREAIPDATKVMLFLHDFDTAKLAGDKTEHEGRGLPDGAKLLTPDPQGIIIEYDGKLMGLGNQGGDHDGVVWDDADSITDITARVTRYLDTN